MCVPVVIAGFLTGGALAVRGGVKAAGSGAVGCACLLAVIEGVGIGMNRVAGNSGLQNLTVCFGVPLIEWGKWVSGGRKGRMVRTVLMRCACVIGAVREQHGSGITCISPENFTFC